MFWKPTDTRREALAPAERMKLSTSGVPAWDGAPAGRPGMAGRWLGGTCWRARSISCCTEGGTPGMPCWACAASGPRAPVARTRAAAMRAGRVIGRLLGTDPD